MKDFKYMSRVVFLLFSFLPLSCTDFLSIQPEDQFLEEGVFSSATNIHNALNGIYFKMAESNSYGGQLTMTTVDLLAQYYNTGATQNNYWRDITDYNYTLEFPLNSFSSIWSTAYEIILNVNNFITQIQDVPTNVLSEDRKNILLGEAYALRAFLHFDILRLFGPVYVTNPTSESIPYFTEVTDDIAPLLPANAVVDAVLADLDQAEAYLINDPVLTEGGFEPVDGVDTEEDFYKMRNRRMNYFAVLALHARVSLYEGDEATAQRYATDVIQQTQTLFLWADPTLSLSNASAPDRIFSSEVLFGIENIDLYQRQNDYFSSALQPTVILTALTARLNEIFPNETDYRYRSSWFTDLSTSDYINTRTFYKFDEVSATSINVRYCQPLIRLSEMYYIMTECTNDISYLNTARFARGLAETDAENLETELTNEYRREFWGEGQTFFYYKRKNTNTIPSGTTSDATVAMNAARYVIPLPLAELNNR